MDEMPLSLLLLFYGIRPVLCCGRQNMKEVVITGIEVEDRRINAKSLLGVLSMGITKGTRISLIAEGPDEEEAVNTLTEMLAKEIF